MWARTLLRVSAAASCAAILSAAARNRRPGTPELATDAFLAGCPTLKARFPALARDAARFRELQQDDALREVLRLLEQIAESDDPTDPSKQWTITRLSMQAEAKLAKIVQDTPAWKSEQLWIAQQVAAEDTLPRVVEHLEALLHNHLLAR